MSLCPRRVVEVIKLISTGYAAFHKPSRTQQLTIPQGELEKYKPLPDNINVFALREDSFEFLDEIITKLEDDNASLAPSFVFCDPYSFKVPGTLFRRLMNFQSVELFINVIWRELDMGIKNGRMNRESDWNKTLNMIFDGQNWIDIITAEHTDDRADQCAKLFREIVDAKWATHIHMEDNGRTRYFLLHLTNREEGRDLMKDCMWKVCPDGGFYAKKSDNPSQKLLITPTPDLEPLEDWVRSKLTEKSYRWQELQDFLRDEDWLNKHLKKVLSQFRNQKIIVPEDYQGRFSAAKNPLLRLNE